MGTVRLHMMRSEGWLRRRRDRHLRKAYRLMRGTRDRLAPEQIRFAQAIQDELDAREAQKETSA